MPGRAGLRAMGSWRASIVAIGVVLMAFGPSRPLRAADTFPSQMTDEEREKWFPSTEEDMEPLSDPDPAPDLDIPGSPRTMKDKAKDWFGKDKPYDDRSLEEREKDSAARNEKVGEEIAALLKTKVEPAPPPPDYELECNDNPAVAYTTEHLVQVYVKKAAEPEFSLLKRLLDNRRELQLLGADTVETYQAELANRLLAKAKGLISSYGKDRNKVLAILGFAHHAQTVAALVGGTVEQSFHAEITQWLQALMPDLLRDLRDKHDYRAVSAIVALSQAIILSGDGAGVNPEAVMAQIEKAMRFDLSLKVWVKSTGANGDVEEWWLDGKIPLTARLTKGENDLIPKVVLEGEGNGRYERYFDHGADLTMRAPGFEVVARIKDFNACEESGTLAFDRFYADVETYLDPIGPAINLPMMESAFIVFYGDKRSVDGYELKVPVVNLQAKAVDTEITDAVGVFDMKITVVLTHKPN